MSPKKLTDTLTDDQRRAVRRQAKEYRATPSKLVSELSRDELMMELMDVMRLMDNLIEDTNTMRSRIAAKGWVV